MDDRPATATRTRSTLAEADLLDEPASPRSRCRPPRCLPSSSAAPPAPSPATSSRPTTRSPRAGFPG